MTARQRALPMPSRRSSERTTTDSSSASVSGAVADGLRDGEAVNGAAVGCDEEAAAHAAAVAGALHSGVFRPGPMRRGGSLPFRAGGLRQGRVRWRGGFGECGSCGPPGLPGEDFGVGSAEIVGVGPGPRRSIGRLRCGRERGRGWLRGLGLGMRPTRPRFWRAAATSRIAGDGGPGCENSWDLFGAYQFFHVQDPLGNTPRNNTRLCPRRAGRRLRF